MIPCTGRRRPARPIRGPFPEGAAAPLGSARSTHPPDQRTGQAPSPARGGPDHSKPSSAAPDSGPHHGLRSNTRGDRTTAHPQRLKGCPTAWPKPVDKTRRQPATARSDIPKRAARERHPKPPPKAHEFRAHAQTEQPPRKATTPTPTHPPGTAAWRARRGLLVIMWWALGRPDGDRSRWFRSRGAAGGAAVVAWCCGRVAGTCRGEAIVERRSAWFGRNPALVLQGGAKPPRSS